MLFLEGKGMVRTMIQLTEHQASELRRLAAQEKTSMAEMVRRAIDHILAQSTATPPKDRLDALSVSGRFDSGAPSIAARHDDELADAYLARAPRPTREP